MTITLTPETETAIAEQARREGTTPEQLVSDSLRNLFVAPKPTPDEILRLAGQVYAGLSEQEVSDVEKIALDRSRFVRQPAVAEAAEVSRTWQGYLDEMAHLREQMQRGRDEVELMQKDSRRQTNDHHAEP